MKTIILFLGVLVASLAQAQTNENQVISSSGGEGQSQGTQISWTIGESVVETKGSGPILSQGFHQPNYQLLNLTELASEALTLEVFPNPFQNHINLNLSSSQAYSIEVLVYDVKGNVVISKSILSGKNTPIQMDLSQLSESTYFLVINGNNKTLGIQQIIKL